MTIVGVVGDTKDQTLAAPANAPQMYRPFAPRQNPLTGMVLMVRTTLDPTSLAPAVRRAVWSVDRNVPIDRLFGPLQAIVLDSVATERLAVLLLGTLASDPLLKPKTISQWRLSRRQHVRGRRVGTRASRYSPWVERMRLGKQSRRLSLPSDTPVEGDY